MCAVEEQAQIKILLICNQIWAFHSDMGLSQWHLKSHVLIFSENLH